MMQSSPLNLRRLVIWIGRLVLGGIFIYAGYAKVFLPNSHFWPWFVLKFSISVNLAHFATQVESYKLLPPAGVSFVSHTLPFVEMILGLLLLIGWRVRIWSVAVTLLMLGFLTMVTRAYLLHMDIDCGCFATPEPISLKKILEDGALAVLAVLMTVSAFVEARQAHPWSPAQKPQTT